MNIDDLFSEEKEVSAVKFFEGSLGVSSVIKLQENAILKEHITKTSALLLCISGEVIYEDQNEQSITLQAGDYQHIEPQVKHWLTARHKSQLILLK